MENQNENNIIKNPEETMLIQEEEIKLLREKNEKLEAEKAVLEEAHRQLIIQIEELSKNAFYDKLTGLKSRAFFDEEMKYILSGIFKKFHSPEQREELAGEDKEASLIIFDLDKFKSVNDSLGHSAGDLVLKTVAGVIKDSVRDSDIAARWGGEEMAVLLVGANTKEAEEKAEDIRNKISEIKFEEYPDLRVTTSAGVAAASDFDDQTSFFNAADKALYHSKNTGRNKVTVHSAETS